MSLRLLKIIHISLRNSLYNVNPALMQENLKKDNLNSATHTYTYICTLFHAYILYISSYVCIYAYPTSISSQRAKNTHSITHLLLIFVFVMNNLLISDAWPHSICWFTTCQPFSLFVSLQQTNSLEFTFLEVHPFVDPLAVSAKALLSSTGEVASFNPKYQQTEAQGPLTQARKTRLILSHREIFDA